MSTFRKRLRRLIREAGGTQTAFIRQVWGDGRGGFRDREAVTAQKGKVNKWIRGTSGIHPDEAVRVARAFNRRPAWLLWGELPELAGVSRPVATLEADVAAYVKAAISDLKLSPTVEPLRTAIESNGRRLLAVLVDVARDELAAVADRETRRADVYRQVFAIQKQHGFAAVKGLFDALPDALEGPPTNGRFLKRTQPTTPLPRTRRTEANADKRTQPRPPN